MSKPVNTRKPSERVEWAYRMTEAHKLKPSESSVLAYLAHRFSPSKGCTWPSQETIARHTGLSRRTVVTTTDTLADRGLLTIYHPPGRRPETGGRYACEYRLKFTVKEQQEAASHRGENWSSRKGDHSANGGTIVQKTTNHGATIAHQQGSEQGSLQHSISNEMAPMQKTRTGAFGFSEYKPTRKEVFKMARQLEGDSIGGLLEACIAKYGFDTTAATVLEAYDDYENGYMPDLRYALGSMVEGMA